MCESSVYLKKGKEESLVMQNVAAILPVSDGKFLLKGLLGERMEIAGQIDEINLMGHKIIIRSME
jgi:predicted RNA-binding protein